MANAAAGNWQIAISKGKTSPRIDTDVTDLRNDFLNTLSKERLDP
jgi:hypothetical protein